MRIIALDASCQPATQGTGVIINSAEYYVAGLTNGNHYACVLFTAHYPHLSVCIYTVRIDTSKVLNCLRLFFLLIKCGLLAYLYGYHVRRLCYEALMYSAECRELYLFHRDVGTASNNGPM